MFALSSDFTQPIRCMTIPFSNWWKTSTMIVSWMLTSSCSHAKFITSWTQSLSLLRTRLAHWRCASICRWVESCVCGVYFFLQIFSLLREHQTHRAMLTTFDPRDDHLLFVVTDEAGYDGKATPILLICTLHEYSPVANTIFNGYYSLAKVSWALNGYNILTLQHDSQCHMPNLGFSITRNPYGNETEEQAARPICCHCTSALRFLIVR